MTRGEISNGSPEWLNWQTAPFVGIEYLESLKLDEAVNASGLTYFVNDKGNVIIVNKGIAEKWNPAEDIRDALLLEEKVKEMGIQGKYCDELDAICCQMEGLKLDFWNCIHATPEQRTKAFLLACLEVKK